MLQTCNYGLGSTPGGGMSLSEYTATFATWSILASQMIISANLSEVATHHPRCLSLLTNPELIAISQDPAALPARQIYKHVTGKTVHTSSATIADGDITQAFSRPLHDGTVACVLLNRGVAAANLSVCITSWTVIVTSPES